MTAEEAKKMAAAKRKEPLANVLAEIKTNASRGEYEMHYYKKMTLELIDELQKLGYKIQELPGDFRESAAYTYKISWK